jgi:ABC-type dipeptide/oligopeptide/nickel transport system permease subunit
MQQEFVALARIAGCSPLRIMLVHLFPNLIPTLLVLATLQVGDVILFEATLSFLGVGTQPPTPSWGLMLSSTGRAFMEQAPWLAVFPGLAISIAVLGFNLFGDTLRDAWDPKLRKG